MFQFRRFEKKRKHTLSSHIFFPNEIKHPAMGKMLDGFFEAVIRYAQIRNSNIDMNCDKLLTISFKRCKDLAMHETHLYVYLYL